MTPRSSADSVPYTAVHIIYNPNSTGPSQDRAKGLRQILSKAWPELAIKAVPTQHAGHAESLAREFARRGGSPLIISASGDGGYNEVVNGLMQAGNSDATAAVLAAGNANDHGRVMQDRPLHELILAGKRTRIDLLRVEVVGKNERSVRWAHSYVGLGLTPVVATELNRHTLNALKEATIAVRTFFRYRPFTIVHNGTRIQLDSLLFANINQMAKLLTLAPENNPADGAFEVVLIKSGHKLRLLRTLLGSALKRPPERSRTDRYNFTVLKPMPMQLDGEVTRLRPGDKVTIVADARALSTIAG